jgi:hypothetical protein
VKQGHIPSQAEHAVSDNVLRYKDSRALHLQRCRACQPKPSTQPYEHTYPELLHPVCMRVCACVLVCHPAGCCSTVWAPSGIGASLCLLLLLLLAPTTSTLLGSQVSWLRAVCGTAPH